MAGGAFSQVQAADTLAKIKQSGKVIIGYRESSDPISYVVGGKPMGYAVDICNNFANELKKPLKCLTLKWNIRLLLHLHVFQKCWQAILIWSVEQPPTLFNANNK